MVSMTIVSVLGVTACSPRAESKASAGGSSPTVEVITTEGQSRDQAAIDPSSAPEPTASQVQSSGQGAVVDVTPMSDADLAAQPTGQSEAGAGATSAGVPVEPSAQAGTPPEQMVVYTNSTYKFNMSHPSNFVLRTQSAEKLAQLQPKPLAAFIFMNPVTASSDSVDLEPADLEIRVYNAGQTTALTSWLMSNGLLPKDGSVSPQPFQTPHVSGVRVCASTMIVPNCSDFVIGSGWIYQLIPVTIIGETMVQTFTLVP